MRGLNRPHLVCVLVLTNGSSEESIFFMVVLIAVIIAAAGRPTQSVAHHRLRLRTIIGSSHATRLLLSAGYSPHRAVSEFMTVQHTLRCFTASQMRC